MRPYEIKNSVEMAQLIAAYEEVYNIPCEERLTRWYGDYGLYEFISEISEEKFEEAKNKALSALGITEAEFLNCEFRKAHLRTYEDIISMMKKRLIQRSITITFDDDDVKSRRKRHAEEKARYKKECELCIHKHLAAILLLTSTRADHRVEIYARYEEIVSLAFEANVCLFAVDSFIEFLREQGRESEADKLKTKLEAHRAYYGTCGEA